MKNKYLFFMVILGCGMFLTKSYAADTVIKGTTTTSANASLDVVNSADVSLLSVRNDGKVGIGTTGPGSKLEVYESSESTMWPFILRNNKEVSNNNYQVGMKFYLAPYATSGTNANKWAGILATNESSWANSTGLAFYVNPTAASASVEKVRINRDGNVGIGTTSPTQKLDVIGNSIFSSTASQQSNVYTITDTGANYGGHDAPQLTVSGLTSSYSQFLLKNGTGDGSNSPVFGFANKNASGHYILGATIYCPMTTYAAGSEAQAVVFTTQSGGTAISEKMRITGTGNVGIGTTAPGAKLQVGGNASILPAYGTPTIAAVDTAGTIYVGYINAAIVFDAQGASADNRIWVFGASGVNENLKFSLGNNAGTVATPWLQVERTGTTVDSVLFPSGGNVGIGTTAPKAKLHSTGSTIVGAANSPVADADLGPGQVNIYVDEASNLLKFKVKYSNGTVKTASVPLQ